MQDIANKRRSNKYCHGPINYIMIKFYISCLAIATLLLFLDPPPFLRLETGC